MPKARVDTAAAAGRARRPAGRARDARRRPATRSCCARSSRRKPRSAASPPSPTTEAQMELARQSILIRELFDDYRKKNPVTDAEAKAEYDKFKAQASGTEYRARHILVENEDEAKALIAQIKGGAKLRGTGQEALQGPGLRRRTAATSTSPSPTPTCPSSARRMAALKKGEMTDAPVKSQFGWHIIRLEDTREAQFPAFDDVKAAAQAAPGAGRSCSSTRKSCASKAKTDYKFVGMR
ncbi:MAG: peptidyl-prolyl cis-trans isomerase [Comamonadaceae bacterium]|nr:peptidyl-prolyl cis-trans isomerase [Comamonadaceae bacterium]